MGSEETLVAQQEAAVSCDEPFILEHTYTSQFRHHTLSSTVIPVPLQATTAASNLKTSENPHLSSHEKVLLTGNNLPCLY